MEFKEIEKTLETMSDRQLRWAKNKASWEHTSLNGILCTYEIPYDYELTPCGCFACTGCAICKDVRRRKKR